MQKIYVHIIVNFLSEKQVTKRKISKEIAK